METLRTPDGLAWIKSSSLNELERVDAVVFDCDGVLVDTRRSYDATILRVVDQLVRRLCGVRLSFKNGGPELIAQLRRTGLFNNDWDTTYALTLFTALALAENGVQTNEGARNQSRRTSAASLRDVIARVQSSVERFCSTLVDDGPAVEAINSFLQSNLPATGQVRSVLVGVQEELGYPSGPPSSLLSTLFDETYHGSQLYKRMYGANAQYYRGAGLIENERRLVRKADLDRLTERLGKQRLAIVTGRPYLALEHTLRTMLSYFNLEASAFIGDADVPPQLRRTLSPFRKPSGQLLIHAQRIFSSQMLLSVGDSAEDVKMAENAKLSGTPALSAGVYGTNSDPKGLAQFFREREVDLILPTARQISTALRFAEK